MRKNSKRTNGKNILQTLLVTSILVMSIFNVLKQIPPAYAEPTRTVKVIPAFTEVNATYPDITFAVVVEDPWDNMSLYGLALTLSWDTTYLEYVNHTCTIPYEDYLTPIAPSPYAGLLHGPILWVGMPAGGVIDETAGTYDVVCSSMAVPPPPSFNGSGTIVILTLHVKQLPMAPTEYVDTLIHFVSVDLPNIDGKSIPHTDEDGTVRLWARPSLYPPLPLLKVTPIEIEGEGICNDFVVDVNIAGEGDTELDPFWDVAGFDIQLNFHRPEPPYVVLEAVSITIDPDGDFGAFWPGGITEIAKQINNTAGTVWVVFFGMPGEGGAHTPPHGIIRLLTVTFHEIYVSDTYPPPTVPITLKNPVAFVKQRVLDAEDGIIDLTNPLSTQWCELKPDFFTRYHPEAWTDIDADLKLSIGDEIKLTDQNTSKWHTFVIDSVDVTLELTFSRTISDNIWAASFGPDNLDNNGLPGRYVGTDDPYDGFGVPNWTGNFTVEKPATSVNSITVHALPFTPDNYTYTLTEGVDYIVHPGDHLIELLTPVDVPIINEYWVDGVNNSLNGWPMIGYVASGIESVNFQNSTDLTIRPARNNGYAMGPPGEWWYDPDWAWELEGWWALGYFGGPETWPPGSGWWINYTAASYLTVDYNFIPEKVYVESQGSYDDGLAALSAPVCTMWSEVFPFPWNEYHIVDWIDSDASGEMDTGDFILMNGSGVVLEYHVDDVHTDITASQKEVICALDLSCEFYGVEPIVKVAGFEHPERALCPWHNHSYSVFIPHIVENATYTPIVLTPVALFDYSPGEPIECETMTFDASESYHPDPGRLIISYTWNFGDGSPTVVETEPITTHVFTEPGTYNVTLTVTDNATLTGTYSRTVSASRSYYLDVQVDVGSIHFSGEIAEYYILVSHLGEAVNATDITATLYFDGAIYADLTPLLQQVDTGLYITRYNIPIDATAGEYLLVVKAKCYNLEAITEHGFLLSPTLTGWNALLISIDGNIATIKTDLDVIQVKLDGINATLLLIQDDIAVIQTDIGTLRADVALINATIVGLITDAKGEVLVEIDTAVGIMNATLTAINATLVNIEGSIATINSNVGLIQTDISTIKATLVDIQGTVGIINSTVGTLEVKLDDINATLSGLIIDNGEILAEIETELGTFTTTLDSIDVTVTKIDGSTVAMNTTLGEVQDSVGAVQSIVTIGITAASILSAIAAVAAVLILLKKKS